MKKAKARKARSRYTRSSSKYGLDACEIKALRLRELILGGEVLALDPSCISASSLPGWAISAAGEITDSGVIDADSRMKKAPLPERIQYLGKVIREEFTEPDVLIVEKVQSSRTRILSSTMEARGALIGNFTCPHVIEIDPSAWRAYTGIKYKDQGGNDYYTEKLKTDAQDAEEMLNCILWLARGKREGDESDYLPK